MARHSFSQLWAAVQAAERHALEREDDDEAAATAEEETAEEDDEETRGSAAQKRRASSAERAPKRVRRRNRKPTYLLQKEEREVLLEEIRILEARAELLKLRSGLPTNKDLDSLASKRAANVEMEEKIHANLLSFARCQSLLSREIILTPINPMKAFIHLPRNIRERRNILRNMKDMRLRRGEQLAAERLSALDKLKPYTSEERFTDPDGTFNCKRFDIVTFEGLDSCREVYEALLYFLANVEISVTETLGHLTIREDSDEFDPTIWNHRVISRNNAGYTEEMNVVGFTRFHDALNFGVVACDSVNVDDLHPYVPAERVRKDITSAHTVSEYRDPTTNELVVVLKRVVFLSVHPPQFPVSRAMREAFQEQLTSWAPVLTKLIRDKVYADREDRY